MLWPSAIARSGWLAKRAAMGAMPADDYHSDTEWTPADNGHNVAPTVNQTSRFRAVRPACPGGRSVHLKRVPKPEPHCSPALAYALIVLLIGSLAALELLRRQT